MLLYSHFMQSYIRHVLPNGLSVHILPNSQVQTATVVCLYRVGSASEKGGLLGASHFLEHMMFKSSARYPSGSVDSMVNRSGGWNNAFTGRDYTAYFHALPEDGWIRALDVEFDRMQGLIFDPEEYKSERQVILEEMALYADDPSEAMIDRHFELAYEESNPYHHPIIGYPHTLKQMRCEDLAAFYRRHYRVDNASLLIVGNVHGPEVLMEVEKRFYPMSSPPNLVVQSMRFIPNITTPEVEVMGMDMDDVKIKLSFSGPSFADGLDVMGELLEEILGGGRSSRLGLRLKEELDLVTGVSCTSMSHHYSGRLFVDIDLKDGVEPAQCLKALFSLLEEILKDGLSEDELTRAKTKILTSYQFDKESPGDCAMALTQALYLDRIADFLDFPAKLAQITPSQCNELLRSCLRKETMAVTIACPQDMVKDIQSGWWQSET